MTEHRKPVVWLNENQIMQKNGPFTTERSAVQDLAVCAHPSHQHCTLVRNTLAHVYFQA